MYECVCHVCVLTQCVSNTGFPQCTSITGQLCDVGLCLHNHRLSDFTVSCRKVWLSSCSENPHTTGTSDSLQASQHWTNLFCNEVIHYVLMHYPCNQYLSDYVYFNPKKKILSIYLLFLFLFIFCQKVQINTQSQKITVLWKLFHGSGFSELHGFK